MMTNLSLTQITPNSIILTHNEEHTMVDETHKIKVTHEGREYKVIHGDPFDRGSADSHYSRSRNPHKGGVGGNSGPRVESNEMTLEEITDYGSGYDWNESFGYKKQWD
jgi:hypothetical protein